MPTLEQLFDRHKSWHPSIFADCGFPFAPEPICLALPEAARQIMGRHADFQVRKKIFAYFLDDHHGDGIVGINCKVLPGDNTALIAADPARFYMPAYVGPRGWVGLRLDVGEIDWEEEELATHSYQLIAPKKLAAAVQDRSA